MGNWQKNLRDVNPYVPGEQPYDKKVIKLNTNENPYPPSPKVIKACEEIEKEGKDIFRKYPDPKSVHLCSAISAYHGVWPENVFVGVGSDDVLATAFLTFFNGPKSILFPDITYSFYKTWAYLYKIPYKQVKLDDSFKIDPDDYCTENGGIVIANPNAPTSIATPLENIEKIVSANPDSVVIIDEAYVDFGGETAIKLTQKYDNLLVVRTFSKSRALAGMRIGYAIGSKELIKALNDVKYSINSYTINAASSILGSESIHDDAYFKETINKIKETRDKISYRLSGMHFEVLESDTNFLFVRHFRVKAEDIYKALRESKVYVRHFNEERIHNYLRITIGTDEEMEKFLKVLKPIVDDLTTKF